MSSSTESFADAINAIMREYEDSRNAGDIDRWMRLWADDGIQMPPEAPANVGKEQIRTANKAFRDAFELDMTIKNEECHADGNLAFSRGTYTATMSPRSGGEEVFIDGKYLTILMRQSNGSWKILRDCFNSSVPSSQA